MNKFRYVLTLLLLTGSPLIFAVPSGKPAAPYINPYLAASPYAVTHMAAGFTPFAGPSGVTRKLNDDEVLWKKLGPVNSWPPIYSEPYPNGKSVIWVGGYDRVAKLDADTLEVLATYVIGGNTFFGNQEIERHIATMDSLDDMAFVNYALQLWNKPFRSAESFYRLLSQDNELYLSHRTAEGAISIQVYGDANAAGPSSKITLRREWFIPADITKARVMSLNMTSNGSIVLVTSDGTIIALRSDFSTHFILKLPGQDEDDPNQDFFTAFVRNGITTDDQNGIYVVTRDHMHRVQLTNKGLSLNKLDGAWSVSYPNEQKNGSGSTPGLMGWGPKEDHLVVIADGSKGNNAVVFWRDTIPANWKGLAGLDRRIAGITPIHFNVSKDEQVLIENAPVIYGYGVFFNATYPVQHLPDQGSPTQQWLAEAFTLHIPDHGALGGAKLQWNPQTRTLKTAWTTQMNLASTVCPVSAANETLYCWGARDREWTLEAIDWNTGKNRFHYTLGKSHRFNTIGGGILIVRPDGAIDCSCTGGLGMVRITPKVLTERDAVVQKITDRIKKI